MEFLCHPGIKKELFAYLSSKVEAYDFQDDNEVYITSGKYMLFVL